MSVATMRQKEPILGCVSKNYEKKNSGSKGLKILIISKGSLRPSVGNYAEINAFTTLTFHIYATQHSTPTTHETC